MTVLKPFVMLACVAFVVGFMGYLGALKLATPVSGPVEAPQQSWSSTTSIPTAADDWNLGKRI